MKARRAPTPLEFKHPISTNAVPAGLFKALANGNGSSNGLSNNASIAGEAEEQRTRRAVRSQLGSRQIFEHASRPSLHDPRALTHGKLITDPGRYLVPAASAGARPPRFPQCDEQRPLVHGRVSTKAAQPAHGELLAHTATKADIEEVRSMMATNADLQVQLSNASRKGHRAGAHLLGRGEMGPAARQRADEIQARVSKVHAQDGQQVALLSQPSERFHGRVFITRSKTGAYQQNHWEDLRRTNEQLAALVSQVQTNEPELEDAQLAHEQVEDSATQFKPEQSPVRMQLDEKDAEERLAKVQGFAPVFDLVDN
ncbi:hypothetical protein EDB85DRAFT_2156960 [Lactarius pseudohatsudake]|nr:hypothetical protein EDB85DRAFT_2156960 [Lactarius pseudohatsudake]